MGTLRHKSGPIQQPKHSHRQDSHGRQPGERLKGHNGRGSKTARITVRLSLISHIYRVFRGPHSGRWSCSARALRQHQRYPSPRTKSLHCCWPPSEVARRSPQVSCPSLPSPTFLASYTVPSRDSWHIDNFFFEMLFLGGSDLNGTISPA